MPRKAGSGAGRAATRSIAITDATHALVLRAVALTRLSRPRALTADQVVREAIAEWVRRATREVKRML